MRDLNFQQEQVLGLLKAKGYGQKVPRWEFSNLSPRVEDFTTRVHELRHDFDLNIQCVNEGTVERVLDGIARRVRCTSYILWPGSYAEMGGNPEQGYAKREAPISSFSAVKPLKSWEEWDRERSQPKTEPGFELVP